MIEEKRRITRVATELLLLIDEDFTTDLGKGLSGSWTWTGSRFQSSGHDYHEEMLILQQDPPVDSLPHHVNVDIRDKSD